MVMKNFNGKKQELTFLIDYHMTDDGSIDIFDGFIDDVFHQNHSEPSNLDGICHSPGVGDGSLGYLGYPHGKQMVNLNLPGVSSWNPKQILKAFMLGWWLWPTHLGLDSIMVLILWTLLLIILLAISDIYTWMYYLIVLECKRRSYINEIWSW